MYQLMERADTSLKQDGIVTSIREQHFFSVTTKITWRSIGAKNEQKYLVFKHGWDEESTHTSLGCFSLSSYMKCQENIRNFWNFGTWEI
jgi:hypothetical protein